MNKKFRIKFFSCLMAGVFYFSFSNNCFGQRTMIRGYASVTASYKQDSLNVSLGEQVLFITSQISDRMSFLGESVFRFSLESHTNFEVSVERIILKYNFAGNHNVLAGKVHTPVSYWNDTYHHGVVFTPTIERPLLFAADIIPLHTTGAGLQAANLGAHKFGYNFFVGTGIGASDVKDNDTRKSITASVRFRPILNIKEFTAGIHYYNDVIAAGAKMHDGMINLYETKQNIWTGSLAYFGEKFEAIAEQFMEYNHTDTTGTKRITAAYVYAGLRINDKLVPYLKADHLHYEKGQTLHPDADNVFSFIAGVRYEINYLSVLKLEIEHTNREQVGNSNRVALQWSVGF